MQISSKDLEALSGKIFTSSYRFAPQLDTTDHQYLTRTSLLTELCTGKDIVHLGCVDHNIEMIEKKRSRGKWLHQDLVDCANKCLGIDLNQEGLTHIANQYGISDLVCSNIIENDCPEILAQNWDYFLIPEVLEHQDNPTWFLTEIRKKYQAKVDKFVITVPNAFDLGQRKPLASNREAINSDHRFWFSPYTLSKVLYQAGFRDITLRLSRNGIIKKRAILKNYILKKRPFLRNNIIAIAS